jgi:hypothetical protein
MTLELELELVSKFPELCKQYGGDQMETCFHWGFECQDGWFDLIEKTLSEIDTIAKSSSVSVSIGQLKSKFGKLVIYLDFEPSQSSCQKHQEAIKRIHDITNKAYDESAFISELSGKPGKLTSVNKWFVTLTEEEEEFAKAHGMNKLAQNISTHGDD